VGTVDGRTNEILGLDLVERLLLQGRAIDRARLRVVGSSLVVSRSRGHGVRRRLIGRSGSGVLLLSRGTVSRGSGHVVRSRLIRRSSSRILLVGRGTVSRGSGHGVGRRLIGRSS